MGRRLTETAIGLGCSERTLRRYINDGLLRGRPLDGYRFELPEAEERYARERWSLLQGLRAALRTERDVRLAVMFGSVATGEDTPLSDVDLLVVSSRDGARAVAGLRRRLSDAVGRRVHVVDLRDARRSASLLADVLAEGRVVLDRAHLWPALEAQREAALEAAESEDADLIALAHRTAADARKRVVE